MSQQRTFKTPKGTELPLMDIKGKPYLSIQHRIVWFREEHPDWTIDTENLLATDTETKFRAVILNEVGRLMSKGHKREDKQGFADHYEKSESGAIGRALGFLGYGTAFALDLEEGARLADAPTNEAEKKSISSTSTQTTHLPTIPNHGTDERMLFVTADNGYEPGNYEITFGKHKGQTISSLVEKDGMIKASNYIQWLQTSAKNDKKPMSQNAQDLIENFQAFQNLSALPKFETEIPKDESFEGKLKRLKNEYPGVQYAPKPGVNTTSLPYADDDQPPFPEAPF